MSLPKYICLREAIVFPENKHQFREQHSVYMEAEINVENIIRLPAEIDNLAPLPPLEDFQVIRPPGAQSDDEFEAFLQTKRCPICLRVPRNLAAICAPGCGHEGCMACLSGISTCPVGRCVHYADAQLLAFNSWPQRAKASYDQELLVKCLKCDMFKSGTVSRLLEHEAKDCPKRIVCCPGTLCGFLGTPEEIVQHYRAFLADDEDDADDIKVEVELPDDDVNVSMQHIARWDSQRAAADRLQRTRESAPRRRRSVFFIV